MPKAADFLDESCKVRLQNLDQFVRPFANTEAPTALPRCCCQTGGSEPKWSAKLQTPDLNLSGLGPRK
jgi:hypothetical protein